VFREIIRITRPFFLFNVVLLYTLGVGMARYYGEILYWDVVILGILWLLSLYFGTTFLQEYFNVRSTNILSEDAGNSAIQLSPASKLIIACAFLAVVASLSVLVIQVAKDPAVFLLLVVFVFGALSYSLPPIKLGNSGYGELVLSVLLANLTPALGYKLMGGDSLHLLAMVTFPLTVLHLAMLLVFSLSTYASDMKYSRRTMMLRMGWQNGMLVHNLLILSAYLLLVLAITLDIPWQIGSPALFSLPIGIYQIFNINRIAAGGKPQWRVLNLISGALFCITAYLLTFSFWIR
jgi:1,4-dihydroxy-2-naphthoate octaprenyltransferase